MVATKRREEYMRIRRKDKQFRDAENKRSYILRKSLSLGANVALKENHGKASNKQTTLKKTRGLRKTAMKENWKTKPRTQAEINEVTTKIKNILKENRTSKIHEMKSNIHQVNTIRKSKLKYNQRKYDK